MLIHIRNVILLITLISLLGSCSMEKEKQQTNPMQEAPRSVQQEGVQEINYIQGEIVVGFKKDVSKEAAEAVLQKTGMPFRKAEHYYTDKGFFYNTGEKFIVTVPKGEEAHWMDMLEKEQTVASTSLNYDPTKINF